MKALRFLVFGTAIVAAIGMTTALAEQEPAVRSSQGRPIALVGGTLIDGTGGASIRNSVVLMRGERIEAIGTIESLPVPAGYERDFIRGTDGPSRVMGSARSPDVRRPSERALLVRHLHAAVRARDHARLGRAVADGRCDYSPRPGGPAARDRRCQEADRQAERFQDPPCTWPGLRSRREATRTPCRRGTSRAPPTPGRRPGS